MWDDKCLAMREFIGIYANVREIAGELSLTEPLDG